MSKKNLIKSANSKGQLAKAVLYYQQALQHYANEANWAVKGDDIVWIGDDDPLYPAQVVLGMREAKKPRTVISPGKSIGNLTKPRGEQQDGGSTNNGTVEPKSGGDASSPDSLGQGNSGDAR